MDGELKIRAFWDTIMYLLIICYHCLEELAFLIFRVEEHYVIGRNWLHYIGLWQRATLMDVAGCHASCWCCAVPLWRKPAICLIRDDLELETVGVYSVPWEYGWYYIGQAGPCVGMRLKEHQWYTCLRQPVIMTIAQQSFNTEYSIHPKDVKVLSTKAQYMDQIIRQSAEAQLHSSNMNICVDLSWAVMETSYSVSEETETTNLLGRMTVMWSVLWVIDLVVTDCLQTLQTMGYGHV